MTSVDPLVWLTALKWVVGADLVWLIIRGWHAPPSGVDVTGTTEARSGRSMFRQGTLKELAKPNALLLFAAVLPQFIDPARSLMQSIVMVGTSSVAALITERRSPRWLTASARGGSGWDVAHQPG